MEDRIVCYLAASLTPLSYLSFKYEATSQSLPVAWQPRGDNKTQGSHCNRPRNICILDFLQITQTYNVSISRALEKLGGRFLSSWDGASRAKLTAADVSFIFSERGINHIV